MSQLNIIGDNNVVSTVMNIIALNSSWVMSPDDLAISAATSSTTPLFDMAIPIARPLLLILLKEGCQL